jgi:uncharacterized protein YpmB
LRFGCALELGNERQIHHGGTHLDDRLAQEAARGARIDRHLACQAAVEAYRGLEVKAIIRGFQKEYGADARVHVPRDHLDRVRQDLGQGVAPIGEEGNVAL